MKGHMNKRLKTQISIWIPECITFPWPQVTCALQNCIVLLFTHFVSWQVAEYGGEPLSATLFNNGSLQQGVTCLKPIKTILYNPQAVFLHAIWFRNIDNNFTIMKWQESTAVMSLSQMRPILDFFFFYSRYSFKFTKKLRRDVCFFFWRDVEEGCVKIKEQGTTWCVGE